MTEELSTAYYCEVCGVSVDSNTDLKRFGKLFCSEDHMNQYVKADREDWGLMKRVLKKSGEKKSREGRGAGSGEAVANREFSLYIPENSCYW